MRATFAFLLLGLAALPAFAVNYSGKWAIQPAAGRAGGRGGPTILVLNQVGNEVTGTIGARANAGTGSPVNTEILAGKVEGDEISFYVWTGTDQPAKTTYKGTMSAAGDEIQFTVTGGASAFGGFGGQGGGQGAGRGAAGGRGGGQANAGAPQTPAPAPPAQPAGPQQVIAKRAK